MTRLLLWLRWRFLLVNAHLEEISGRFPNQADYFLDKANAVERELTLFDLNQQRGLFD